MVMGDSLRISWLKKYLKEKIQYSKNLLKYLQDIDASSDTCQICHTCVMHVLNWRAILTEYTNEGYKILILHVAKKMCFVPFSFYEFCHSTMNAAVFNRRRTGGNTLDIANRPGQTISETWFRCFFVLRLNNDIRQDKNVGQDIFPGSIFIASKYISKKINNVINT